MTSRIVTALATCMVAGAVASATVAITAPLAHAAAYRYWSFWQGDGSSWTYATAGPAAIVPQDGDVEGWRLTVGGGDAAPPAPSGSPSFSTACGSSPERAGYKRVALVIDPGPAAIAPEGETPAPATAQCIQVPADASAFDVLRAATSVRTQNGLVCAIAGYPARECATPVDESLVAAQETGPSRAPAVSPAPTPAADPLAGSGLTGGWANALTGSPVAGLGVLAIVIALGWMQWKRRRG